MKHKNKNNCTCICDTCDYEEILQGTDFETINNELRKRGWIITKYKGEFVDFCSKNCYNEFME